MVSSQPGARPSRALLLCSLKGNGTWSWPHQVYQQDLRGVQYRLYGNSPLLSISCSALLALSSISPGNVAGQNAEAFFCQVAKDSFMIRTQFCAISVYFTMLWLVLFPSSYALKTVRLFSESAHGLWLKIPVYKVQHAEVARLSQVIWTCSTCEAGLVWGKNSYWKEFLSALNKEAYEKPFCWE